MVSVGMVYDFGAIPEGHIISVTGHRPQALLETHDIRLAMPAIEVIQEKLLTIAEEYEGTCGDDEAPERYIVCCGMGPGFDQWCGAATLMLKKADYPFELWLIIPWRGFEHSRYWKMNNAWCQRMIEKAVKVDVLTEVVVKSSDRAAQMAMIHDRNKHVAKFARSALECYDGREEGGTYDTRKQMIAAGVQPVNCYEDVMRALRASRVTTPDQGTT